MPIKAQVVKDRERMILAMLSKNTGPPGTEFLQKICKKM